MLTLMARARVTGNTPYRHAIRLVYAAAAATFLLRFDIRAPAAADVDMLAHGALRYMRC